MRERGLGQRAVEKFKLGFDGERLVIPYLTPAGPLTVKRRCLQSHDHKDKDVDCPKYKCEDGSPVFLFNAQTLLKADRCVIVEGELDAVAAEMAGVPAVAYPGASNWQRHFAWCFDSCEEVVVVGDGDEPGVKAAKTVTDSLRAKLPDVEIHKVILPPGEDSNSYIQKEGAVAFLDLIGFL